MVNSLTNDEEKVIEEIRAVCDSGFGEVNVIIQHGKIKDMIPSPRIRIND